ncbi:AraC family transcriptional regulator [Agarivorans sp. 1_MG-2023]|uniref:AraC family transcriptional regulator n=1 Tax=Agarivorans sp. 1_MG-2023 TaxID=3062634 RepID=UPI0026E2502B|nr:AraC family transcriptional regulator [Agarivorans sp. 1_MG-2023]
MKLSALSSPLAKKLGHSHLRVAGEYWHLSDLLQLQHILLSHAPSLKEGLVWWSKSLSLFERNVYIEISESNESLDLTLSTRDQQNLPAWSELLLTDLHASLSSQVKTELVSVTSKLCFRVSLQELEPQPAKPALHSFAKKVFLLLQHQAIESPDLQSQLKRTIQRAIDKPLSIDVVAKQLGLSTRTLQRRLSEKQLNFSKLVDDEKQTLALNLLADTHLSVAQVALKLGYDDPSNFHRSFRRWFSFTPSFYRQQCQQNRIQVNQQPVRLHYARGSIGLPGELHTQEGQVWLEVDNIAFEKVVTVECKDQDGIWRHYPAFFDDFLADGTELWSTANLPVAQPLSFRLRYDVDGETYIDDNQQRDYLVSERLLLGAPAYIVPTLSIIKTGFAYQLFIELACRIANVDKILCYLGEHPEPLALQQVSTNSQYSVWTLSSPFPALAKQCHFRLYDKYNQELALHHYPKHYQFVPPLM